jgi:hypothetical protein
MGAIARITFDSVLTGLACWTPGTGQVEARAVSPAGSVPTPVPLHDFLGRLQVVPFRVDSASVPPSHPKRGLGRGTRWPRVRPDRTQRLDLTQILRRYGASARRTYDRIMTDT